MAGENPYFNQWATKLRLPRQWKTCGKAGVAIVWACDAAEAYERCQAMIGDCSYGILLPTRQDGR